MMLRRHLLLSKRELLSGCRTRNQTDGNAIKDTRWDWVSETKRTVRRQIKCFLLIHFLTFNNICDWNGKNSSKSNGFDGECQPIQRKPYMCAPCRPCKTLFEIIQKVQCEWMNFLLWWKLFMLSWVELGCCWEMFSGLEKSIPKHHEAEEFKVKLYHSLGML